MLFSIFKYFCHRNFCFHSYQFFLSERSLDLSRIEQHQSFGFHCQEPTQKRQELKTETRRVEKTRLWIRLEKKKSKWKRLEQKPAQFVIVRQVS